MKVNQYLAKTLSGLESIAIEELEKFGATEIEPTTRGAFFKGTLETLYKINLGSRFIVRVLKPLLSLTVFKEDYLYKQAYNINWASLFNVNKTIKVEHNIYSDSFKNSQFLALKLKDAIVDSFRDKTGERPNVELDNPDILVNIHMSQNHCTILLDASGNSLHFRGYKKNFNVAPLNEILAAGMVKLSGWDFKTPLYDAMCGSGTILIEAALMACNKAPNISRNAFPFLHWKNFDQEAFNQAKNWLIAQEVHPDNLQIFASDLSNNAINITNENAEIAGVGQYISAKRKGISQLKPETETGLIIINPPYGERMGDQDEIAELYKKIGDTFKFNFPGFTAWIISSNIEALKAVGLKPNKRIKLYNGKLECSFNRYTLYSGSLYDKAKTNI